MKKILIFIILLLSACAPKNLEQTENANPLNNRFFTSEKIIEREVVVGEATTTIIDNSKNRVNNINIACRKISGMKLSPAETFSFNDKTGKKTKENGYLSAPILNNGEKSFGIGGGVCQASSTIYMAAKNAGLEIKEHHNHSTPVAYAKEGTDATVVYGIKDLKIKNNTNSTLYIYTWIENNKVFAKIIKKSIDIQ